ncbi:MAG: bacteriocin [Leptolyngbyaceae cyanobacterium bins.349]|nr:bacteriocin [Leptolyngbyaceae cyanobacterium bins.349]
MSLVSEATTGQITELSEDELEAISGGLVNVSFTLLLSEENCECISQESSRDGCSELAISGQRQRSLFGLQFSGTFQSMEHFSSFFSRFSSLFGGR